MQRLVVSGSQLSEQGVQILRGAVEEGLLPALQSIDSPGNEELLCWAFDKKFNC